MLRSSEHMLLNGALFVRLNQVASELALGLKPHMDPSFVPLWSSHSRSSALCPEAIIVVSEEHRDDA